MLLVDYSRSEPTSLSYFYDLTEAPKEGKIPPGLVSTTA